MDSGGFRSLGEGVDVALQPGLPGFLGAVETIAGAGEQQLGLPGHRAVVVIVAGEGVGEDGWVELPG